MQTGHDHQQIREVAVGLAHGVDDSGGRKSRPVEGEPVEHVQPMHPGPRDAEAHREHEQQVQAVMGSFRDQIQQTLIGCREPPAAR